MDIIKEELKHQKNREELKQKIESLKEELAKLESELAIDFEALRKEGFVLHKLADISHYVKYINERYIFWFYIPEEDAVTKNYSWGVSDIVHYANLIENDFNNFDDCFANYLKNKSNYVVKKFRVIYDRERFVDLSNYKPYVDEFIDTLNHKGEPVEIY
jgi:hypothetical protein